MSIKVHYRKMHPEYRYPCNAPGLISDQCGRVFLTATQRDKHVNEAHKVINTESGEITYVAAKDGTKGILTRVKGMTALTKCGQCFESSEALASHIAESHKDTFECKNLLPHT